MDPRGNSCWMLLTLCSVGQALRWHLVVPEWITFWTRGQRQLCVMFSPLISRNLCSFQFMTSHQFGWCFKARSHGTGVGPEWINLKLIWFWKTPSGCVWERQLDRYINKWSSVFIVPDVVSKNEEMAFKKNQLWGILVWWYSASWNNSLYNFAHNPISILICLGG